MDNTLVYVEKEELFYALSNETLDLNSEEEDMIIVNIYKCMA